MLDPAHSIAMPPEALAVKALDLIRVKLSNQEASQALSGIYGRRVNHEDIAALLSADSNTPPPWLPGITFLDNEILPVAAGYASSTNTIYINQNAWGIPVASLGVV